jgi:hypothetical protein
MEVDVWAFLEPVVAFLVDAALSMTMWTSRDAGLDGRNLANRMIHERKKRDPPFPVLLLGEGGAVLDDQGGERAATPWRSRAPFMALANPPFQTGGKPVERLEGLDAGLLDERQGPRGSKGRRAPTDDLRRLRVEEGVLARAPGLERPPCFTPAFRDILPTASANTASSSGVILATRGEAPSGGFPPRAFARV